MGSVYMIPMLAKIGILTHNISVDGLPGCLGSSRLNQRRILSLLNPLPEFQQFLSCRSVGGIVNAAEFNL